MITLLLILSFVAITALPLEEARRAENARLTEAFKRRQMFGTSEQFAGVLDVKSSVSSYSVLEAAQAFNQAQVQPFAADYWQRQLGMQNMTQAQSPYSWQSAQQYSNLLNSLGLRQQQMVEQEALNDKQKERTLRGMIGIS